MKSRMLLIAFAALLSACGSGKSGSRNDNGSNPGPTNPSDHGSGGNQTETYELNGKPADEYYKQFLYKKDTNENPPYRYLVSGWEKMREEGAKTRYYDVSLFLLQDGSYVLRYEELFAKPVANGLQSEGTDFTQELRGTWKVDKADLVISDIGTGTGLVYNDADTVALRFDRNIHTEDLSGKMAILKYGRSSSGL